MTILKKAIEFAKCVHTGTQRRSGEPFLFHPLAVMSTLRGHGFSETVLCAAVLHDVIEDSGTVKQRAKNERILYDEFGEEVYFLVTALSKDFSIVDKKKRDSAYLEQLVLGMQRDSSVLFIKMADLLHNVSTLEFLPLKKQVAWIHELKHFYLHRFLENFHVVPPENRDFYLNLVNKLEGIIEEYEKH